MACNISIDFTGDAATLVQKLSSKVTSQGGTFEGNEHSGSIKVSMMGTLSGSYTINGQQIDIVITEKPFIISCSQIKSYLAGNL